MKTVALEEALKELRTERERLFQTIGAINDAIEGLEAITAGTMSRDTATERPAEKTAKRSWGGRKATALRTCAVCNQNRPISYFAKSITGPDGRKESCRDCCRAERIEQAKSQTEQQLNPKPAERVQAKKKRCNTCHIDKAFHHFAKDPTRADGRREACNSCRSLLRLTEQKNAGKRLDRILLGKERASRLNNLTVPTPEDWRFEKDEEGFYHCPDCSLKSPMLDGIRGHWDLAHAHQNGSRDSAVDAVARSTFA